MWVLLYCDTINHPFKNRKRANKKYHKGLNIVKPKSVLVYFFFDHENLRAAIKLLLEL